MLNHALSGEIRDGRHFLPIRVQNVTVVDKSDHGKSRGLFP
jgi:hypothetical protein